MGVLYDQLAKWTPSWKRPEVLTSMSLKRDLGESQNRCRLRPFETTGHGRNEDFKLFMTLPLWKRHSTASDPEAGLHCSPEDHIQHEEKRSAIRKLDSP